MIGAGFTGRPLRHLQRDQRGIIGAGHSMENKLIAVSKKRMETGLDLLRLYNQERRSPLVTLALAHLDGALATTHATTQRAAANQRAAVVDEKKRSGKSSAT